MFNEMSKSGALRPEYEQIQTWVETDGVASLLQRREEAEALFRKVGITFAVYGEGGDPERLIPFDMIPRIFSADEWSVLERGTIQRSRALNAFLADIYGAQKILDAGLIPRDLVLDNPAFEKEMIGVEPPGGVWSHICGIDVVRTGPEDFLVLEDNCRTPSGVSYMLESREVMMQMFPSLFSDGAIRPVDTYPDLLADAMSALAPPRCDGPPTLAILTPGSFNSAYYEHSFLADRMGVELVEGQDLYCENGHVWMRTIRGPEKVDVIYRRIDDAFLDPEVFNPDSVLGVPGLMDVYRTGGVTLVNAPGTGVADDKAIYIYVPDMIRFYLGEEPILKNVPTYRCELPDERDYVLANLSELVVKEVQGSGGYGMLIGPKSTPEEQAEFAQKIRETPDNYIAQPTLALSTAPILTDDGLVPRHVDLRPFVITGAEPRLVPGGLTRVAMREGSLVVNSSQGGGVKDTWVLDTGPDTRQEMPDA
ncbi:MAG: circularly permuted type 2 ATP-grasp protein [Marinibacterium sp.]|nr:circularly permuted type 2 ATP-grasp protein [Marinibacterium sp.]